MNHYYSTHPFSEDQARHATDVVMNMMRERRFFLYHHDGRGDDPNYTLDPHIFADAIKLDNNIRVIYEETRSIAEASILGVEQKLGFKRADLSGNKKVVKYKLYTGGFDICRVYPFTSFATLGLKSFDALVKQQFDLLKGERTEDDLAPKKIREYQEHAENLSGRIWDQLEELDFQNPQNHRCLVMLQSCCDLSGEDRNRDFAEARVWDIQKQPHAVGYLFYNYLMQKRIAGYHGYIVSSTSRASHVAIQHWRDENPSICYNFSDGYECNVNFITVL